MSGECPKCGEVLLTCECSYKLADDFTDDDINDISLFLKKIQKKHQISNYLMAEACLGLSGELCYRMGLDVEIFKQVLESVLKDFAIQKDRLDKLKEE